MNHTELEKFIHAELLKEGWEPNQFGVISADFEGGSCNLTYVIADIIRAWEWFAEYVKIANDHFSQIPEDWFDIGYWDSHEQDYLNGYTPQEAFYQDLYTDI